MADGSGLEALEPWLAGFMARLAPAQRLQLSRRIGVIMRRLNSDRIRKNVQPDGTRMQPRKDRRGRVRARKGPMFRKIGLIRNLRIKARPDEVEVQFTQPVSGAAAVHHFGLVDRVENRPGSIRTRYPARKLLGFGPEDRDAILEEALDFMDR